ncbi:MAG TPA: class I SAM-dependent methyltransferase, partial [Saprospiraceae bacterium]|nr:class I SAM-dependent methyltransferase [Saprospiraceae bacterium]
MDQSRYAEGLNRCCELLGTNQGKLLDLGCGPGNVSRYLIDKIPWLRVEAIDLSPAMVALAQNNLPTALCSVGDVR